jgi:hypothetical protein
MPSRLGSISYASISISVFFIIDPADFDPVDFVPVDFDPVDFDPVDFDPVDFDPFELPSLLGGLSAEALLLLIQSMRSPFPANGSTIRATSLGGAGNPSRMYAELVV